LPLKGEISTFSTFSLHWVDFRAKLSEQALLFFPHLVTVLPGCIAELPVYLQTILVESTAIKVKYT